MELSSYFVPILSPNFLQSGACSEEMLKASEKSKKKTLTAVVAIMDDYKLWDSREGTPEQIKFKQHAEQIASGTDKRASAESNSVVSPLCGACYPERSAEEGKNRFDDDFFGNCRLLIEVAHSCCVC